MKIGIAALRIADLQGGNTESIYSLASALKKEGVDISFLLPQLEEDIPFKVEYFGSSKTFYNKFELGLIFLMLKFLYKIPNFSKKVDLLQLNLPTPAFSFLADIVTLISKSPVVVNFDAPLYSNLLMHSLLTNPSRAFRSVINSRYLAKFSNFSCRYYIVSSSYQKEELKKVGCPERKIKKISNTFNVNKLIIKKEMFNSKTQKITYIGHFNWHKGVDVFIKSIPKILKKRKDVKFVLAWSGRGDKTRIDVLIKKLKISTHITFLDRTDIASLLYSSSLLVLPYRVGYGTQSFPNIILESFYLGIPIVVTSVLPIREIFDTHKKTGIVVEPENPFAIAEGVLSVLQDKKLRENMIEEQRKVAASTFLPSVIAGKYISEVYEKCL